MQHRKKVFEKCAIDVSSIGLGDTLLLVGTFDQEQTGIVMDDVRTLVMDAQGGSLEAYDQLIARFADMAFGAAFARLGDEHLAQDATQESFIEAYRDLSKIKDPAAFPGWFRVIVFRKSRRIAKQQGPVSSPIDGADAIASDSPGPLDQIQAQEMKDHLREALAALPEAQRMVTTLYYIKDYKTREISEFLEVPMTTVKRRLDLARKKLKTGLQKEMRDGLARKRPSDQRVLTDEIHVHISDNVIPKPPRAHGRAARDEVSEKDEAEGEGQYEGKSQKEADRELWQRYHEAKDDVSRNVLIERYLPLVQLHAQRIAARLPSAVDTDDLCSGGVVGLVDAIVSFDPDRGVCFEAFSGWRIKGAMFDELRSMDWVPRLVRLRASKMANAIDRLSKQDGSLPTEEELKRELDVDSDEYSKIRRDAAVVGVSSLSKQLMSNESDGKDLYEVNVLIDPSQPNPLTSAEKLDMKHTLLRGMSRSECLIIVLYYYEQMTMREIADTLDLSESRISQMHSLIIQRLKSQLNYRRGAGAECAVA